eukprot:TRINITY_DN11108_c0_g1_i2.p1 TRINITY_DN11108_c0_g1~~TRINITY_DN11108_c0_g1_i2.p1  ORF type:complete len:910 (-),score=166.00 TRINITY_DN11108_c0_g1_i2:342-2879(-)
MPLAGSLSLSKRASAGRMWKSASGPLPPLRKSLPEPMDASLGELVVTPLASGRQQLLGADEWISSSPTPLSGRSDAFSRPGSRGGLLSPLRPIGRSASEAALGAAAPSPGSKSARSPFSSGKSPVSKLQIAEAARISALSAVDASTWSPASIARQPGAELAPGGASPIAKRPPSSQGASPSSSSSAKSAAASSAKASVPSAQVAASLSEMVVYPPTLPCTVDLNVDANEVAVPVGKWSDDQHLEIIMDGVLCTATVKVAVPGCNGVSVVLRVGLQASAGSSTRIAPDATALRDWTVVRLQGSEQCDLGKLPPPKSGARLKSPHGRASPSTSAFNWQETMDRAWALSSSSSSQSEEVSVETALASGNVAACDVDFLRGLSLRARVRCEVRQDGVASVTVDVDGDLRLRPRLRAAGLAAMSKLYSEARTCYCAGDVVAGLQKCQGALEVAKGRPAGPLSRVLGDVLNLMGSMHLQRRRADLAVRCLNHALTVRSSSQGGTNSDNRGLASTLSVLGSAHQAMGASGQACDAFQRAADLLEPLVAAGEESAGVERSSVASALAAALQGLAGASRAVGQLQRARRALERSLALREGVYGANHALCAVSLHNLGAVLQELSETRECIRCYQRALAVEAKVYGASHQTTAATLGNLGAAHSQAGEHRCAANCHWRALEIQEQSCGESEHPAVATSLHNLGNALVALGELQKAASCFWRALAIWTRASGGACTDVAATLHSLGSLYRGLEDPDAAARCFAAALRIRDATLGNSHPETARSRHCLALVQMMAAPSSIGGGARAAALPAASLVGAFSRLESAATALPELQAAAATLLQTLGVRHPWSRRRIRNNR